MKSIYCFSIYCLFVGISVAQGQAFPNEKTRYEYSHTASTGKPCRFEVGLKGGTADYYWNGERQIDKLEPAGIQVPKGKAIQYNVYKVEGKDLWFFFPTDKIETKNGKNDYPMYYSRSGKTLEGAVPIDTRGPTRLRTIEVKD